MLIKATALLHKLGKKSSISFHFLSTVLARNLVVTRVGVDSRVDFGGRITALMGEVTGTT
ncbi:hypothetical protein F383_37960 [Gossypium arboreum]|uniref:Uncharacterized protein n=1 Tax=Gossypium arboreum TaxID=29729 RepID=A0A0B0MHE3_GOSAR|nr:hypothetical protein F383_37960 [Gossypium arboreum]